MMAVGGHDAESAEVVLAPLEASRVAHDRNHGWGPDLRKAGQRTGEAGRVDPPIRGLARRGVTGELALNGP
jgi:hypothetical protein